MHHSLHIPKNIQYISQDGRQSTVPRYQGHWTGLWVSKTTSSVKHPLDGLLMWYSAMSLSGGYGKADDEESLKVLAKAIELGCTFWDTAQVYGNGHNEELIGRFLKENPGAREKIFIGSKCGFEVSIPSPSHHPLQSTSGSLTIT